MGLHASLFVVFYFIVFPVKQAISDTESRIALVDKPETKSALLSKKDSLNIKEVYFQDEFRQLYRSGKINSNKILLVGNVFDPETKAFLSDFTVEHLVNIKTNQIQNLTYKAFLKQNQTQYVHFNIDSEKKQVAKIRIGNLTLDSTFLEKGKNSAELSFPVFGLGRNEMWLELGENISPIRFFATKASPLHILVRCQTPDFEIKTLAEWLRKQGHAVNLVTDLSTNMSNQISYQLNKNTEPIDLLICSPDKINATLNYKAKSVFILGLSDVPRDIQNINKQLRTNFQIEKKGTEISRILEYGAEASPYTFKPNWQQSYAPNSEIIRQGLGVGTTLLNTTYQLVLAGDSIAYSKIWNNMLQLFPVKADDNQTLMAPFLINTTYPIRLNSNTLDTQASKTESSIIFKKANWQTFQDSLEVFVDSIQETHHTLHSLNENKILQNKNISKAESNLADNQNLKALFYILFVLIYGSIWLLNRQ